MVEYHPFSDKVIDDPHAVYARLREEAPCYYIEDWNAWAFSRFEDVWRASMDAEHYTATKGTTTSQVITKVQPVNPNLNAMDPPQHTQLRSKLARFFTPGAVRRLEPKIREFVDDAWAELRGRDEVDLYRDFAAKVSVKVACLANGFPMEDSDYLNQLVWRFFAREEGQDGMTEDGVAALMEMIGYFGELIDKRRAQGITGENPVDCILTTEVDGALFDDESAGSHLTLLIIGGAETFPKVFASAAHRLWQHPDQRAQCTADPSRLPEAFREVLRYDMPTQFLMRVVTKEHRVQGQTLLPEQPVLFLFPSANRDPREFDDPDTFDITRNPERILSFGHGIHACVGQHFAKLEGRLCLERLLAEAPDYAIREEKLARIRTEFVQGWEAMPAVLRP